jgi:site-specific recombinase XerC
MVGLNLKLLGRVNLKGGIQMKMENAWKEQETVKDWLQGLGEKTKEHYLEDFPKFLQFAGMQPNEIIESRLKHLASDNPKIRFKWEQKVLEYKAYLKQQNIKEWTVHTYLTCVLSFFSRNRVKLQFRRGDIGNPKPKRHEWIPSNTQVRMVYQIASIRDKVGLLLAYQCGLNPVDIEGLNIEEMPIYDSEGKVQILEHQYFEVYRSKTGTLTQTCLSHELLHDIDLYLRSRGYPKKGALLVSHKGERLSGKDLNTALKGYFKIAVGKEAETFHMTKLRKAYQNALDNTPTISKNYSELMMGHSLGVTGHYSKPSSLEIKASYDQAFPKLSINGYVQNRSDLKTIGEKVDKQEDTVNLIARALARMVAEQKKLEGLSLMEMKDVQDFLRNYVAFEEVLRKPRKASSKKKEEG